MTDQIYRALGEKLSLSIQGHLPQGRGLRDNMGEILSLYAALGLVGASVRNDFRARSLLEEFIEAQVGINVSGALSKDETLGRAF